MKITTRDQARKEIGEAGITVDNVTKTQLAILWASIDKRMQSSGNYRGSYLMLPRIHRFMSCKTDQWGRREAISFNSNGFIGIAGWADDSNVQPILDGVGDWLDDINDAK